MWTSCLAPTGRKDEEGFYRPGEGACSGNPGSRTRIECALLMTEPPGIDADELTDKGHINQSAALAYRATLVEKLYADPPGNDVVVV